MYSKEDKKTIRKKYWSQFKVYSNKRKLKAGKPGKWIMNNTGIKHLKLKFHFDTELAWAGIEIDTKNLDKRIDLFDKFEKLKTILSNSIPVQLIWELDKDISEIKSVSRIYTEKKDVNIYNIDNWKDVNKFLYEVMDPIEDVFREYEDFFKF